MTASAACCVPLEGGYGLGFKIVGRPDDATGQRRRRVDDRVARLLRGLQDSGHSRPDLHVSRHEGIAARRHHQRGDGEAILEDGRSAERPTDDRPRRHARVRRRAGSPDHRRRRRQPRRRAESRSRPEDVHPAGAGARQRQRAQHAHRADVVGGAHARAADVAGAATSRSSCARRPACRSPTSAR